VTEKAKFIHIQGARAHNLKSITLDIPRNKLVVFTGVSGSGKSSLVFDTIYAEGHRRYVESLSSYARQFLSRIQKPDVDLIHGLSPAIAIEQRVSSSNPRSTVGTVTEILDYLRLLYARIGTTFSPVSGNAVTCHTVSDVVDVIAKKPVGTRIYLTAHIPSQPKRTARQELEIALQKGFSRIWEDGQAKEIEEVLKTLKKPKSAGIELLVDRFVVADFEEEFLQRMADSVQTAFNEGHGRCNLRTEGEPPREFSELFELDGIVFEKPSVQLFNFNNSYGACPTCEGFGRIIGIDEDLVIPDKNLSVYEEAVAPWRGATLSAFQRDFIAKAGKAKFPIHKPYHQLSAKDRRLLWEGNDEISGINDFFKHVESQAHKVQYRVLAARYRGYTTCPECNGSRLRKEALYVKIDSYSIADFLSMAIEEMAGRFAALALSPHQQQVADRILLEINSRLAYLKNVGLGYLNLSRKIATLSGGEMQRINLATSLGSNLTGSLYILDEPSIGLHPRDNDRLMNILLSLRTMGNSVLVVEHDEALMRRADHLVDIGPLAGEHGGEVVAAGSYDQVVAHPRSITGKYLGGEWQIDVPKFRRKPNGWIHLKGARENNLQNVDASLPLGVLTVVTGVSGSGKSTLIKQILFPALMRHKGLPSPEKPGEFKSLEGDLDRIDALEMIDQQAIGKNLRSNPVTYVGAYDGIRELYANLPAAKERQLKPLHFSFNVQGGRCETCQGEGLVTIQMQFLPDIKLVCDTCGGKRFKQMVLEVTYKDKNIYDVLELSVEQALAFFADKPKIATRLQKLMDVGLGYVRLGQSTSTLSGGEAQRLKLASFLDRQDGVHTLYLFDEPTTGLHFHDVKKLMDVLHRLVNEGNTVVVVEHNLDVIKCADWLLDMGPDGGVRGGNLVYAGVPEGLPKVPQSFTGQYLAAKLKPQNGAVKTA
jgi:excinuclease ABC subunit A